MGLRFLSLSLLVGLLACGCAGVRIQSEEIYTSKTIQVKLVEEVDKSGKTIPKGYSHPWNVDNRTLEALLASICYRNGVPFLKKKDREAFPKLERLRLLEPLRKAFARATPDQAVDFTLLHSKKWMLFQRDYLTDGLMFVREGAFHCAFRNIAFEELADPEGTAGPFRGDPTERPYRTSWSLEAGEGQALTEGDSGGLLGSRVFHNWIRLDLSRNWIVPDEQEVAEEAPPPVEVGTAAPEPLEVQEPAASPPESLEEIEKQLDFLEELYREGALSGLAYEKKKKDLLERAKALSPAEE